MRKSMKQRVALFLSFAMAFTSVDSSALAAAADTTEVVSEEAQQEAAVEEEAAVQQEEAAVEEAVVQQEDAAVEEAVVQQEDAAVEEAVVLQEDVAVEEAQQEDAAVEEVQQDEVVSDDVVQEEEAAPVEETPAAEEELTVDEQPSEDQAAEETGEEQQEESASAEDTLTEETESVEEEGTEEAEDNQNAITEENGGIEEQIIGEELYDLEEESVAVADAMETVTVSGITDIELPENTQSIVDLDNYNMGYGTQYTIEYSDGSSENATINDEEENYYGFTGQYGNYIEYYFKREGDDSKRYSYGEEVPVGKYELVFYADGKEICPTGYVFTNVEAENAELPELRVGSNEIVTKESSMWTWYQFTATEGIKYHVDRCSGFQVCTRINGNIQNVPSDGDSFKAPQNGVYYLGFGPGVWDNEIEDYIYTWTASLNKIKKVTGVQVDPAQTQFYQEEYPISLSSVQLSYDDETTKIFEDYDNIENIDGQGNGLRIFLTSGNSEEEIAPATNLAAGTYTVHVRSLDDSETVETIYTITILEDKTPFNGKAEVTEFELDKNYRVKLDAEKSAAWFSYKPEKDMEIIFESFGDEDDYCDTYGSLYDSTGSCLKEDDEGGDEGNFALTYKLEAGKTYYFKARLYRAGNTDEFFVTLKEKAKIVGIESISPDSKQYIAHLDTDIISGTSVVLKYSNGKTAGKLLSSRTYIKDQYGYRLTFDLLNEKSEVVESDDDLPAGNYALAVSANGEQVAVSDYVYKVADASEAGLTELKTGDSVAIESGKRESRANWYQFKAEKAGRYQFEKYSDMKVVYFADNGEKTNISVDTGSFKAEEGKVYYIGFYGEYETDDEYVTSWKTRFSEVPVVTAIEVTPKYTNFYAGVRQNHANFGVQFTYADHTTADFTEWYATENIDGKGNGINIYLTADADTNRSYDRFEELETGNYTVHVVSSDNETVEDTYKITVSEVPTPFNGKAEAVDLKDGKSYSVNVDETRLFQWFRYTATEDMPIIFCSEGNEYTYVRVYDQNGEEIPEDRFNDGEIYGDDGHNFRIYDRLDKGTTYYFRVSLYSLGNTGSFTVRLREKLTIQALEVVKSDLKTVYPLKEMENFDPEVWVKATYNREGVSETFYWKQKDSWDNSVEKEILDENDNAVDEINKAGVYTLRLRCGNVTAIVGKFQVTTLPNMVKQEISLDQEKQLSAEESRLVFRFTVQERGMYKLTSNAPTGNLKLYNQNEKQVQYNGVDYHGYAVLDPGTYYVYSDLENGITKLRVSVKKAALPQKITAVFDGEPLIAGVDTLNTDNISTRVEYTDGSSAWIYGEATDAYDNRYDYEVVSEDGEQEYYAGDGLPEGTYTVEPKVRRALSYWGIWHTNEEEALLNQVLTSENRKPATITVTKPDVSQMTQISENEDVEVKGTAWRYFYAFTAKESGKYEIESEDGPDQTVLYSDGENKLIRKGNLISVNAGETCVVLANHRFDYKFRIVKQKSDSQTSVKSVQSIKIQSEQDYLVTGDTRESLSLLVTYADRTTEKVMMPYVNDGYYEASEDGYGNEFEYKNDPKEIRKEDGTYIRYEVVCGKIEATAEFPLYDPEEKAIEITTEKPADGKGNGYFKFVPNESRTYILRTTAKEQGAVIDRCITSAALEDSYGGTYKGQVIWQTRVDLHEGETYYFKALAASDLNYTVSVLAPKNITDIQIVEIPESYEVYQGIENYNYDGFKVKVTYEDGSEEILEEDELTEAGTRFWIYDREWVNESLYRLEVRCGKYETFVDIPAKTWTYTGELKEKVLTNAKADSRLKAYAFTPAETNTYRFGTTKDVRYQLTVYNSATQKQIGGWYGQFKLQKGVTYTIAFYLNEVDGTEFGIWAESGLEHIHDYVEDRVEPTCVTPGYTQNICSSCGTVEEGSYKELPAAGHKFGDWVTTVKATCTGKGTKQRICSVCGEKEEATVAATDHKYVTDRKESTCTSTGYTQEKCSICGTVKSGSYKAIAKKAHQWKTVVDKKPTCGVAGSQHRECTECGTKEKATAIAATGKHSYGKYVVTKKATLFAKGSKTRTCKVCGHKDTAAIAQIPGTIKLTVSKIPLQVGKTVELSKIVTGLTKGDSVASYTSANTKLAIVTKTGRVTGKAAGNVKVTVKLKSGKTAAVTIAVQKRAVATTSIQNLPKTLNLKLQEKKQLSPVIAPISTTDKLSYVSSDVKIVSVTSKGLLTAKKAGKAKVTVKSGKKSFTITVTVTAPAPTGMKNLATAVTLKKGKTLVLKPVLLPAGAQAKITYKSSNTKVAAVDASGKITAKGKGTAQITITAGKVKKTCKVTVK